MRRERQISHVSALENVDGQKNSAMDNGDKCWLETRLYDKQRKRTAVIGQSVKLM